MKILSLLLAFTLGLPSLAPAEPQSNSNKLIEEILAEASNIKPGQTRKDLLVSFNPEDGLFDPLKRKFISKKSPYIKITVEFKPVKNIEGNYIESPEDIIILISKPFLEVPLYN